jgi:hypothetical protein
MENEPKKIITDVSNITPEPESNLREINKLHALLGGEAYSTQLAKDAFLRDLKKAQRNEKEYCSKHKLETKMTSGLFNEICGLVDTCKSMYDVEALAGFIFEENYVPSVEELKDKGRSLHAAFPFYEMHKAVARRGTH